MKLQILLVDINFSSQFLDSGLDVIFVIDF